MIASKDVIMLISCPHSKFRLVNFLSIGRPLKQLTKIMFPLALPRLFVSEKILEVLIEASVLEYF